MPRVEQNGMPTSLHYALTDSQCSKCGKQLEWNAKELEVPMGAGIEYIVTLNNTPLDISSDFKGRISFDDEEKS